MASFYSGHFEVFLVTSKKQGNAGNGIIESKVGIYQDRLGYIQ
jgi:hypothetical protein